MMIKTAEAPAQITEQGELFETPVEEMFDVDECLPTPQGYRILVALPEVEGTFGDSGIAKSEQMKREERVMSTVGAVIDMGVDCYKDADKFPTGPWCKVGDFIMFRANSGTRFLFNGVEYRLMNDDSVEAVVPEPKAIGRVI